VFLKGCGFKPRRNSEERKSEEKKRGRKSEEKGAKKGRAKKGRAKKEWRLYGLLKNSILGGAALSALR